MPTPWTQDQLTVLSQSLRDLIRDDRLASCPQWPALYELTRERATAVYAGRPEHFRFRGIWAALTLMLGQKVNDPALLREAEQVYEALVAGSPRQPFFRYQLARLLTKTGGIEAGGRQLAEAMAADPRMGESVWRLGVHRWVHENQAQEGARLIIQSMDGLCRHPLANAEEAKLLAQAYLVRGDRAGLASMERWLRDVPNEDPRLAPAFVEIARFQEELGLLAERDRFLRRAVERDGTKHGWVAPVLEGRVKTLAEAETSAGGAGQRR